MTTLRRDSWVVTAIISSLIDLYKVPWEGLNKEVKANYCRRQYLSRSYRFCKIVADGVVSWSTADLHSCYGICRSKPVLLRRWGKLTIRLIRSFDVKAKRVWKAMTDRLCNGKPSCYITLTRSFLPMRSLFLSPLFFHLSPPLVFCSLALTETYNTESKLFHQNPLKYLIFTVFYHPTSSSLGLLDLYLY